MAEEQKATTLKSLEKRVNELEAQLSIVAEAAIISLKVQRYAEPQKQAENYQTWFNNAKIKGW